MPIDFNRFPYHDDFTPDDNYYRLLFRPGRAVQARELTQIQTLLQNQIQNLSSHIFKDGALVSGGQINYDRSDTKWLAIQPTFEGSPVRISTIMPGSVLSKPARTQTVGARTATISSVIPAENQDPNTIYFKWDGGEPDEVTSDGFLPGEILGVVDKATGITKYRVRALDQTAQGVSTHYGTSTQISVTAGVYYWKGVFVQSTGGSLTLSKYTKDCSYRVGYIVKEQTITDDPKTLDPASNYSNFSAPGADRYKITLTLVKIGDGSTITDEGVHNFIEIARITNGNILVSDTNAGQSIYNVLGKKIAERTFEESGNYVAERFNLQLRNKTTKDNPVISAHMNEGVAYVGGYRHSLNFNSTFDIKKGRDAITETIEINNTYGDNYVVVNDRADTENATNPENANGLFVVGSGAGVHTSTDDYGQRGAAVSIHSVPKHLVERYSLTDQWKWASTLVGTARPTQFMYDVDATNASRDAGRFGQSYDLYLGDFKSANVANTVSVDNVVELSSAYSNASHAVFVFPTRTHGITTDDRISVSGVSSDGLNVDFFPVVAANDIAIVTSNNFSVPAGIASVTDGGLLYRTTGNVSASRSVVLDSYSSAAWNGSYIGGTIRVGNSSPKTIIDYIGTNSEATSNYSSRFGYSKAGMVVVDSDFESLPKHGDTYTVNMPMSQARSIVYNQNISATGADQYPAVLNQSWNIDPISGVVGKPKEKLTDLVYGNRVDGDTGYNRHGNSPAGEDALIFDIGRSAVKSVVTHGSLDTGLSGNTEFYYTEYSDAGGDNSADLEFAPGGAAIDYNFFDRPVPYPYADATITDNAELNKNYTLVNESTGQLLTNAITEVVTSGYNITVTTAGKTFDVGSNYVLLYSVKATEASPAYKKLVKANRTYSGMTSASDLTDYANGHVLFAKGTYSNAAGSRFSLGKPDLFKVHKVIKDVENSAVNGENGNIANSQLDITSSFILDNGQRDSFYDNASLVLKSNVNAPSGNVLVIFDRFERVDNPKGQTQTEELDSPGFFSVDSYQYTTDLTLNHAPDQSAFTVGMGIKANNGTTAYVLEYANTSGVSKMRLQDVRGPVGVSNPEFVIGETITGFTESGVSVSGDILSVVTADIKYSEIPEYKSPSGKIYPLRSMIDARPYVVSNNRVSDTIADSMTPFIPSASRIETGRTSLANPMETVVVADSFAGRIDKVIVTADGDFKSDPGVPAFQKYPPKDRPDKEALTLFTINIPPYTFSPRDIQIKENPAMRHTMQDIGRLARRVENLEYYVSLDMLEKQMSELDVVDENGFSRFKNGIIVDDFNADSIMSNSVDNIVGIGKGELRPQPIPLNHGSIKFTPFTTSGTEVHNRNYDSELNTPNDDGEIITLDYTTEAMITQPLATTSESVNPFDIQNFTGDLTLSPDVDHWFDTTKVPEYSSILNTIFEVITELSEDNSTTDEITNAILSMNDFWNDITGEVPLGDNITSTGVHFETPTQSSDIERNIELGTTSTGKAKYWVSAELDAAIATHGMTDGMTKSLKILPYIRSRHVVLKAQGLKPNHTASVQFDGVGLENRFARATEIYMQYDPRTATTLFQPDVNGKYEKVKLSDETGGRTANGILLAVRVPTLLEDPTIASSTSRYMLGYVVPVTDDETGLIDYENYADGYYGSSWSEAQIRAGGWQGSGSRSITGYKSGATASLIQSGTSSNYYNGHYTGTARNTTSNTTHIVLSGDAHRYVAANFQKDTSSAQSTTDGYPENAYVTIVSGSGAGQQVIANSIVGVGGNDPTLVLRDSGLTTAIDSTSVYSISMKPVSPYDSRYTVSQIGSFPAKTNHYGEKMGILHIPSDDRVKFTTGRKLVEIADRYSQQAWRVTSYASGYYEAAGKSNEQVSTNLTPDRLNLLREVRSKVGSWRVTDHPDDLDYVPARNAGQEEYGRLAVVTGISFDEPAANGTWTAESTDGISFVPGSAGFGVINSSDQTHFRERFNGIWRSIRDNYPEVYDKYYRGYFDQWIIDTDVPDQED